MTELNTLCFEYLKDFTGAKCCIESVYRLHTESTKKRWYLDVINDAFNSENDGFWGWLDMNESLLNMSQTIEAIEYISDSHIEFSDVLGYKPKASHIRMKRGYTASNIIVKYGKALMLTNYDDSVKCIEDKMNSLYRLRVIGDFDDELTDYMSSNEIFSEWILNEQTVAGVYKLSELCVDEDIDIENIIHAFECDMSQYVDDGKRKMIDDGFERRTSKRIKTKTKRYTY